MSNSSKNQQHTIQELIKSYQSNPILPLELTQLIRKIHEDNASVQQLKRFYQRDPIFCAYLVDLAWQASKDKQNHPTAADHAMSLVRIAGVQQTLPTKVVKSITYDNGSENSRHLVVNKKLDCKSYFCHPYHWEEKGAVEEIFSLVRRFFSKGTDFAKISRNSLKKVENLLNNRPRKCLDYQTPIEVFEKRCGALQN